MCEIKTVLIVVVLLLAAAGFHISSKIRDESGTT